MSVKVKVNIDPNSILARRGIGSSDKVRLMVANQVASKSDPYIPFDRGMLKNNHYIEPDGSKITYKQKYASYQWNGHFKNYSNNNGGLRGPRWTERMMQARGREIVNAVADYVGGKAK